MTHYKLRTEHGVWAVEVDPDGETLRCRVEGIDFRIALKGRGTLVLDIDGSLHPVELLEESPGALRFRVDGEEYAFSRLREAAEGRGEPTGPRTVQVESILPGKVASVPVQVGTSVHAGDPLVLIDSMKMETAIRSDVEGKVTEVLVARGDIVRKRQPLVKILTVGSTA